MGWVMNATPQPLYPQKDPVPIVQEAGFWTGAENLALTGIRSPDRPVRSESLYRLSYSDPMQGWVLSYNSPRKTAHSGGKSICFG
jgi:hypothetical protein